MRIQRNPDGFSVANCQIGGHRGHTAIEGDGFLIVHIIEEIRHSIFRCIRAILRQLFGLPTKDHFADLGRIDLYRDFGICRRDLIGNPYIFVGVAEGLAAAAVYSHNVKGHTGLCQSNRQIHIAAVIEEIIVKLIRRAVGAGCQLRIGTIIDMEPKGIAPHIQAVASDIHQQLAVATGYDLRIQRNPDGLSVANCQIGGHGGHTAIKGDGFLADHIIEEIRHSIFRCVRTVLRQLFKLLTKHNGTDVEYLIFCNTDRKQILLCLIRKGCTLIGFQQRTHRAKGIFRRFRISFAIHGEACKFVITDQVCLIHPKECPQQIGHCSGTVSTTGAVVVNGIAFRPCQKLESLLVGLCVIDHSGIISAQCTVDQFCIGDTAFCNAQCLGGISEINFCADAHFFRHRRNAGCGDLDVGIVCGRTECAATIDQALFGGLTGCGDIAAHIPHIVYTIHRHHTGAQICGGERSFHCRGSTICHNLNIIGLRLEQVVHCHRAVFGRYIIGFCIAVISLGRQQNRITGGLAIAIPGDNRILVGIHRATGIIGHIGVFCLQVCLCKICIGIHGGNTHSRYIGCILFDAPRMIHFFVRSVVIFHSNRQDIPLKGKFCPGCCFRTFCIRIPRIICYIGHPCLTAGRTVHQINDTTGINRIFHTIDILNDFGLGDPVAIKRICFGNNVIVSL